MLKIYVLLGTLLATLNSSALFAACEMTIFGHNNKPPKYYVDENDQPRGILVDMMMYAGEEMNCKFNIKLMPWQKAYSHALKGEGGIIGLSLTSQRLEIFDYSQVMFNDDLMLVVRENETFEYNSLEDLVGKRIGLIANASYGDQLDAYVQAGKIASIAANDPKRRLHMLIEEKIDVALLGPGKIAFKKIVNSDPSLKAVENKMTVLPKPFRRDSNHLGFSKKLNNVDFLEEFNDVLKKGYASGKFNAIFASYQD